MAVETKCQTPGAIFHTTISDHGIIVSVDFPHLIAIDKARAELIEANLHNVIELVLANLFTKDHETRIGNDNDRTDRKNS